MAATLLEPVATAAYLLLSMTLPLSRRLSRRNGRVEGSGPPQDPDDQELGDGG